MVTETEELTVNIGVELRESGDRSYYVEVIRHFTESDESHVGKYIKKNGKIERWDGRRDYMQSYEECLAAIAINYDILRKIED